MQSANLVLSVLTVMAAALGLARAILPARRTSMLLGVYGLALIASGIFPPDPMAGFPEGTVADGGSLSGILHLAFGAVGFVVLAVPPPRDQRGAYMMTATPTRQSAAPMRSKRSGTKRSNTTPQASEPATNTPP